MSPAQAEAQTLPWQRERRGDLGEKREGKTGGLNERERESNASKARCVRVIFKDRSSLLHLVF